VRRAVLGAPPARDFTERLRARAGDDGRLGLVAEIKRRSPSKGDLAPELDAGSTAAMYERGGACCLSVLTDAPFFGGSVADLQVARVGAPETPVLRKDFIIDPDQVYETRGIGADAILLIAAALPDDVLLRDLHDLAVELGLGVLVEVHDEAELDRALGAGARIVGVNNRNLRTLEVDLDVSFRLAPKIPVDVVAVAESGLQSAEAIVRLHEVGYRGFLVGERAMTAADPGRTIGDLLAGVAAGAHRAATGGLS
jgi:indole-3-glycerol phosphate synthase